jgi:hypothetical protein
MDSDPMLRPLPEFGGPAAAGVPFDWRSVLLIALPVVFGALGTAVGYAWKGRVDRRNVPDIELLKAFLQDRRKQLDELDGMLFNLDHWLRTRIPAGEASDRPEVLRRSRECLKLARERSRTAAGFTQEEKVQLIELVRQETDAAKECLTGYERGARPELGAFDVAQRARLAYTRKLAARLPS